MDRERNIPAHRNVIRTTLFGLAAFLGVSCSLAGGLVSPASPTPALSPTPTSVVLTDQEAGNVASQAAVAYFTVDYQNSDAWLDPFRPIAEPSTLTVLEANYKEGILPALEESKVISTAKLVSAVQIAAGADQIDKTKWQIWKVEVSLDAVWPEGETKSWGPYAFPWPTGTSASVHVAVFEITGRWQFAMFPSDTLVKTMTSITPSPE